MTGRNISVTHVALKTVRVMRTTATMGEAVGMATAMCRRYETLPRAVSTTCLPEPKSLVEKGCGHRGLPNNQQFNIGCQNQDFQLSRLEPIGRPLGETRTGYALPRID